MAYSLPTLDSLRTTILNSWRNLDPAITVTTDSDNYIRASGFASALLGLYHYFGWGINQMSPESATLDNLIRFGTVRGVLPKLAVRASGTLQLTGTPGAVLPSGAQLTVGNVTYRTTDQATVANNNMAVVAVVAIDAGIIGNQPGNTPASLQSAPLGLQSAATLVSMRGGKEAESHASYLARVLDRLRTPPAGGNAKDYQRWALEVEGVTFAQVFPLRRGLGTVDIAILSGGAAASDALRHSVADYIDAHSPAGCSNGVVTFTPLVIDITAQIIVAAGVDIAVARASAALALTTYFSALQPGVTVSRSRLLSILADVSGVTDVSLTAPAASVPVLVDAAHLQLATLGNMVWL